MSTKDISRFLFQPRKHYVGMRMQQGRVTLDSDHNEGAWHEDEDERRTLRELIGPQGSPDGGFFIGYTTDTGVGGTPQPISVGVNPGTTSVRFNNEGSDQTVPNYWIMPGTMYVGGLRVELEQPEPIVFQSDYLQNSPILGDIPSDLTSSSVTAHHFFFLKVWEQCVTAVEDEEFLERALGGPDTSVRVRRMRRVEYLLAHDDEDCITALERALNEQTGGMGEFVRATGELKSPGRLLIEFAGGDAEDTCAPCHPDPTGRYLGAENQAIRIMLVDSTHFVWAYDNASPLYRVTLGGVSDTPTSDLLVTMLTLPKDEEHWPLTDRVVEILPWSALLDNGEKVADEIGVFCRVSKGYTPDGDDTEPPKTFRIDRNDPSAMAALNDLIHAWDDDHPRHEELGDGSEPRHFYVRFWHQVQTGTTPILIPTSSGAPLGSTGIVPNFREPGLRGDYWIAALRPETPDRVVPFDLHTVLNGVAPHGPRHFYAPLAMIDHASNVVTGVEDCRKHIVPVTDQGCCTIIVGDGVHSVGQYTSIQAAIDALPPQGGEVCIRPGLYREEIVLANRNNVVLVGCGDQTVIETPATPALATLLEVRNGFNLTVRSLTLRASGQRALHAHDANTVHLTELRCEALTPPSGVSENDALVFVKAIGNVVLESIDIKASRRIGLQIENCGSNPESPTSEPPAILRRVAIEGATAAALPPVGPLSIIQFGDYLLDECRFLAFGQFAVFGNATGAHVKNCTFVCDHFTPDHQARSAIYWTFVQCTIEDCTFEMRTRTFGGPPPLSQYSALEIWGTMLFQNNFVKASPTAWGGVQIRTGGGRNGIPKLPTVIKGNRILGGAGHGITLGAVQWDGTAGAPPLYGVGRGQMMTGGAVTGNLRNVVIEGGFQYTARCEVPTGALEIVDNYIEGMGTNGISVVTLFGWRVDDFLPVLNEPCRITGNRITRCLQNATANIPLAEPVLPVGGSRFGALAGYTLPVRMLPLGGIVLGGAGSTSGSSAPPANLEICDNIIEDNAPASGNRTLPISGIFVLGGDSITISGNRIARNGFAPQPSDVLQTGTRAGIAVALAGMRSGSREQITASLNDASPRLASSYSLHLTDNTVEQPEGRALFAVGTGSMSVENNFFSSLGFHGSTTSPEALADIFAIGDVVYVHNLGRPWEITGLPLDGPTSGIPNNNFPLSGGAIAYIKDQLGTFSYTVTNVFFVGLGGQTLFANNQVVYDWTLQRVGADSLSFAPVALISHDHLAVRGNQFGFRLQTGALALPTPPLAAPPSGSTQGFGGRPVLSQVLALGYSVEVSGNRASEGLDDCEASIFSIGFSMNSTTQNQGTHCTIANIAGNPDGLVNTGNKNIITPTTGGCGSLQSALAGLTNQLLEMLEDRRV